MNRGSRIIAPVILYRWRCVVTSHTGHFNRRKKPPQTLSRRMDGPQKLSGHTGGEKHDVPLPGFDPASSVL